MPSENASLSLPVEIYLVIYQHLFNTRDRATHLLPILHICHQFRITALPIYFGSVPFDIEHGFLLEDVNNVSGLSTRGTEGVDYSIFRFDNGVLDGVHNMTSIMIRARRPLITTRCRPLSIAEARAEVSEERKEDWAIHSVQGWSPSRYIFLGKGWSHAMRSKRKWHLIGEASVSVRAWKSMMAQINIAKLSYPQSRRTESILQTLPLESNLRLHSLLEGNRTPADIGGSVG